MDYSQARDDMLVRRVVDRDSRAIEELYDRYARATYSLALRVLGDPEQAEDVTQDIFLRVWRQPERFDPARGNFSAWLLGIAHHRAIDLLRSQRSHAVVGDRLRSFALVEANMKPEPEDLVMMEQRRAAVQSALTELPAAYREALELAFYSGLTHVEIADRTRTPLGTVKTRIRTAMQRLRTALDAVGIGAD